MDIKTRDLNSIVIFDIDGDISRPSGISLHQLVKSQLERGNRSILLNFSNVGFIDSFGVGEILASYISTNNLGGKLKLARISKKLYLVFQVTMLTRVLEIYDDEAAALKSFEKL
jgi:anti-sigma B factor antagonist